MVVVPRGGGRGAFRGGKGGHANARRGRSDPWIGETVIVNAGSYKSLMGFVKDATENSL